jgi:hypothetical protein
MGYEAGRNNLQDALGQGLTYDIHNISNMMLIELPHQTGRPWTRVDCFTCLPGQ